MFLKKENKDSRLRGNDSFPLLEKGGELTKSFSSLPSAVCRLTFHYNISTEIVINLH
jgi:hypothetical protein